MFDYEGRSSNYSVAFESDNYEVKATRRNNKIKIDVDEFEDAEGLWYSIDNFLENCPFIRGIYLIPQTIIKLSKIFVILFLLLNILSFMLPQVIPHGNMAIRVPTIYFVVLSIMLLFSMRLSQMSKFHGAEHMVCNTVDKEEKLTMDNIRKNSRIHLDCGTNFIVFVVLISIVSFIFVHHFIISVIIGLSIGNELFELENKWAKIILSPIYFIGNTIQYIFTTAKPSDKHIEVARAAMQKLLNLENYPK